MRAKLAAIRRAKACAAQVARSGGDRQMEAESYSEVSMISAHYSEDSNTHCLQQSGAYSGGVNRTTTQSKTHERSKLRLPSTTMSWRESLLTAVMNHELINQLIHLQA